MTVRIYPYALAVTVPPDGLEPVRGLALLRDKDPDVEPYLELRTDRHVYSFALGGRVRPLTRRKIRKPE